MLIEYQQLTRHLLGDAGFARFNDFDLTDYINQARLQVAAQGVCTRTALSLTMTAGTRLYQFSAITFPSRVAGIYHIRQIWYQIFGTPGLVLIYSRPFEWLSLFRLNNAVPPSGAPQLWSQYGQGEGGSFVVDPIPDLPYLLSLDTLGVPSALADDTSIEVIPRIWTLAVPFYAAWWALQGVQNNDGADKMLERYQQQMAMARSAANPDLTPESWSQSPDMIQANRLGMQVAR